jgi:hypothetical protein
VLLFCMGCSRTRAACSRRTAAALPARLLTWKRCVWTFLVLNTRLEIRDTTPTTPGRRCPIASANDDDLTHRNFQFQPVRSAYQPPANITFLSKRTGHQQPASSTLLSEQTSTSHQPTEQESQQARGSRTKALPFVGLEQERRRLRLGGIIGCRQDRRE